MYRHPDLGPEYLTQLFRDTGIVLSSDQRQLIDWVAQGVYPIGVLLAVMQRQPWMRRFDFDTEAVVRLAWRGVVPINLAAPVKYLSAQEGGVSHFRYGRDNVLLTWMHTRLMLEFVLRLPLLIARRLRGKPPFAPR